VLQSPAMMDRLNVEDNLLLAAKGPREVNKEAMSRLLEQVGISQDKLWQMPQDLSGGEKRRIAIIRALIREALVTIFDEPTAGLDVRNAGLVCRAIRNVNQKRQAASIVVTHDPFCAAVTTTGRVFIISIAQRRLVEHCLKSTTVEGRIEEIHEALQCIEDQPESISSVDHGDQVSCFPSFFDRFLEFSTSALPLVLISAFLLGAVLAVHASRFPLAGTFAGYIPGLVVDALIREIIPLVIGLLLAGQLGSQIAAEVGGLAVNQQLLNLRLLGWRIVDWLHLPVVSAIIPAACLLTMLASLLSVFGAALMFAIPGIGFGQGPEFFLAKAVAHLRGDPEILFLAFCKAAVFGLVTGIFALRLGVTPKSTAELGIQTTKSVVLSSVVILVMNSLISILFR